MKITILTLFKNQFDGFLNTSIIKRAIDKKIVEVEVIDFRMFSLDKNLRVDEPPIGGGAGMIIKLQPLIDALKTIKLPNSKVYLLSAKGKKYSQKIAHEFVNFDHLILICGHYEGIDERILNYVDGEISIGDYILTGGELGAMVIADSVIRLIDGAILNESKSDESFENGLLEYDQYASPRIFDGYAVPDILYSGNHKAIKEYRFKNSYKKTLISRPDLLEGLTFSKEEDKWIKEIENDDYQNKAIIKAKKFMK